MNIKIQDLSFSYDEELIFDKLSFEILGGCYTTIIGSNGSGKSTLAKLIASIIKPDSGFISIIEDGDSCPIDEKDCAFDHKSLGLVFQNPDNQFVNQYVKYDIIFGLENICLDPKLMDQRIEEFSELMDISEFLDREISTLSGGQKQRVAITGILSMGQKIIILDEATSMLDPESSARFVNYLVDLAHLENLTIISITHDMQEALVSDDVIVLDHGMIMSRGNPRDIFYSDVLIKSTLEVPYIVELTKRLGIDKKCISLNEIMDVL